MDDEPIRKTGTPKLWRRIKQYSMPETTWLNDLEREARMPEYRVWLKRLNSRNPHIRQEALRVYRDLPPVKRRLLTVHAYRHATKCLDNTVGTGAGLSFICVVAGLMIGGRTDDFSGSAAGFIAGILLAILILSITISNARRSREQELAHNLIDSETDPGLVPFLLLRLQQSRNSNRAPRQILAGRSVRNGLARLLPRVQEEHAAEWTGGNWQSLFYYLRHPWIDVEITVLTLQMTSRVGGEEALILVKSLTTPGMPLDTRLLKGEARSAWEANKLLVEQTAQSCLPALEARVWQQRQMNTLLRAADADTSSNGEILLRPASGFVGETPAEQLLRPQNEV